VLREAALMFGLTATFLLVGAIIGYIFNNLFTFTLIALILAVITNMVSYFFCDKIVMWMTRAKIVSETQYPDLYLTVAKLSTLAGIPRPKVGIIPSKSPNAFATGRNPEHAVVCVTEGALKLLNRDELEGVLSHEIAHVKHRDILIQSLAATIVGALSWLAYFGRIGIFMGSNRDKGEGNVLALLGLIFIPFAAVLMQLAISREREYKADEGGAKISGKPISLANALQKISDYVKRGVTIDSNPSTNSLWIAEPFSGGSIAELFSTHPRVEKRVARLKQMANKIGTNV
jgi:heat shock protein HtpX